MCVFVVQCCMRAGGEKTNKNVPFVDRVGRDVSPFLFYLKSLLFPISRNVLPVFDSYLFQYFMYDTNGLSDQMLHVDFDQNSQFLRVGVQYIFWVGGWVYIHSHSIITEWRAFTWMEVDTGSGGQSSHHRWFASRKI